MVKTKTPRTLFENPSLKLSIEKTEFKNFTKTCETEKFRFKNKKDEFLIQNNLWKLEWTANTETRKVLVALA